MPTVKENYFDQVFQVVRLIPWGKVTTYGAIAHYLGLKSGARMVGYALNASHHDASIPAHRVVNRMGLLTGKNHFNPPEMMQKLLENEGIVVYNDKIRNFEQHFWNPIELELH